MHPYLHLIPAAVSILSGLVMTLALRDDIRAGITRWRDGRAWQCVGIVGVCLAAAGVSFAGAVL